MTVPFYTAVLLGLGAALGFGLGDLCARTAGRMVGSLRAMFFGGVQGLVLLSLWLAFGGSAWPHGASVTAWMSALAAALLNLGATSALFRAFAAGKLALVAPVIASYGAVTVILSIISGESVTMIRTLGVIFAVGGVALASSASRNRDGDGGNTGLTRHSHGGLGWALLAALGYGATFWILGRFAIPELGGIVPVWLYYVIEIAILLIVAVMQGVSLRPPKGDQILPVLGNGVIIALAYITFALGLASGEIGMVTVLSSLSSAVTVMGAAVFLGERLVRRQWAGAAAILIGLVLINSGR